MPSLAESLDPFAGMSPTDMLKLRQELAAKQRVSPEQAAANRKQTLSEALSVIPGPGNVISAHGAYTGAQDAAKEFGQGNYGRGALSAAMAGVEGIGAVTGLPFGRTVKGVAKDAPRTLNIFAGPTAKTADHAALAKAQEMAQAGGSRDDIWANTGWFQGVDGKWRFEIDDSKAYYDNDALDELREIAKNEGRPFNPARDTVSMDGVIGHPNVYAAYPDIGDIPVHFVPPQTINGAYGGYAPKLDRMALSDDLKRRSWLPTSLHEVQHAIQKREGFAPGGKFADPDYRALAGEVEARNVEKRILMNAEERRKKAPWLTQDTQDTQQIVRQR